MKKPHRSNRNYFKNNIIKKTKQIINCYDSNIVSFSNNNSYYRLLMINDDDDDESVGDDDNDEGRQRNGSVSKLSILKYI